MSFDYLIDQFMNPIDQTITVLYPPACGLHARQMLLFKMIEGVLVFVGPYCEECEATP